MKQKVIISEIAPEQGQAWDAYVLGNSLGNAYQLYGFGQAVHRGYGFPVHYLAAWAGQTISGILPLVRIGFPGLPGGLVSLPYCDAAGILADSPEVERALLSFALKRAAQTKAKLLSIRSSEPIAGMDSERTRHHGKVRMVMDLPFSPERLLASLKAKVRSQVRKPLKDGLTFELGGAKLLDSFYTVFRENMRDLGSPIHHRTYLHKVLSAYRTRAHVGLVRLPDKTPAAAGIILCHPKIVSIPWASSLRRWNRLNPNMLLYWGFLSYAAAAGFSRFDFGRSTPGEGTYRFKRQWGAVPEPLFWADFDPGKGSFPLPESKNPGGTSLRPAVAAVFSRTPIPLMTWTGSRCRKYISL